MQLGIGSTARRKTIYSVIAGSILFLLSLVLIPETLPNSSSAESGVEAIPSLTISGSHSLSLTVNPGQFGTTDAKNLLITTTNYTGYNLTIAPSTGNSTELVNTAVNTATIPSIANTTTASSFENLSTAAYGLSTDDGTTFLPITNGGELYTTNSATDSTTGGLTLKLGAKAISSTPSGTYTKTFTLTATANPAMYSITYDKNTEDAVSNLPASTSGTMAGTSLILSYANPSRTGFRFVEWNTERDGSGNHYARGAAYPLDPEIQNSVTLYAIWGCNKICYHGNGADAGEMEDQPISGSGGATSSGNYTGLRASNFSRAGYGFAGWNTKADGTGTTYGPSQTLTTTQAGNGLDLYAKWIPAEKDENEAPVYLQGWTGCSAMSDGQVTALTDNRDGNVYAVAKIEKNTGTSNAYSKCWLIENLRIDVATVTITDINTNHPTASFKQEASSLSSAFWDTCQSSSSACNDHISYGLGNINGTDVASYKEGNQNTPWYSYGGMYNWYTATAGNGTYGKDSGNVNGSICPSGWDLPSGKDATGDYGKLDIALGGTGTTTNTAVATNRWRTYPINFVYSSYYTGSLITTSRGDMGYYWSSTAHSGNSAYNLCFQHNSYINPGNSNIYKYYGMAVRCLSEGDSSAFEQFTLTYSANGGDEASVPPVQASTTIVNGIYTFTLSNTIPTRSGFTFAGWIDEYGAEATPGGEYIASDTSTTLYARWTNNTCNPTATTIDTGDTTTDAVCLQDLNSTVKAAMTSKATYTLKDARDNQTYTISKLDDGNVWMTQNLRLGAEADANTGDSGSRLISSYDSDLASQTAFIIPASTTSFETTNNATSYTTPKFYLDSTNGGYYSFATAIADKVAYTTANQNLSTSICPSGWDLPNQNQYNALKTAASLTSSNAYSAPYSFQKVGYKNGISAPTSTTSAYVWTSTNNNESTAYYSSGIADSTTMSYDKRYGIPIRCVTTNGTTSIKYYINDGTGDFVMQDNVDINSDKLYSSSAFSRGDAYVLKRWDTASTGDGSSYAFNADISTTSAREGQTLELYAIWNPKLKVVYHINIEGDTTADKIQWIEAGTNGTLGPPNHFTRNGYKIVRWDTDPNGEGTPYATRLSYTASANTQAGDELHLYAIWAQVYSVIYNANDGDCGNNTATCMQNVKHINVALGDTFTLFASNYSRSGYGYAGWSTEQLDPDSNTFAADLATAKAAGLVYGPNETITATSTFISKADSNKNITLYAIWVAPEQGVTMQTFDPSATTYNNTNKPIGSVIALNDARDTNVYAVAKLADGNWWMIENLRLENTATINTSNTQSNNGAFGGVFTGLADPETGFPSSATANSLYSTTATAGKNQITGSNQAYRFPRYNNYNTTKTGTAKYRAKNPSATDDLSYNSYTWLDASIYSYGNYYTWAAAIADTTAYSTNNQSVTTTSLCPTGWHLPKGGNKSNEANNEWWDLATTIIGANPANYDSSAQPSYKNNSNEGGDASRAMRHYPTNLVLSGNGTTNGAGLRGSRGVYWSSTSQAGSYAYTFDSDISSVYPGTYTLNKTSGYPIRCLSSTPVSNNTNNNASPSTPQQQNEEPQATPQATPSATPSAAPSAQSMSFSAPASSEPTDTEPTDAEDQTEDENDSKATSTAPLGVKRSSDETNPAETIATTNSGTMSESDGFGLVALVGAGVATTSGLLLLFGKRRKKDEEDESEPEI